ncbi:MAG: hypothetical protein FGF52_03950 [Candidatus Brockarchaeota archaeon]|nr:hypothetical protein [Candidatus Brockarchaeota archaeon]
MHQKIARIISYALSNPVTGSIGGLAMLMRENTTLNDIFTNTIMVLFFYSLLPFASVYYLRLRGKTDMFMSERTRRPKHFIPGLLSYAVSMYLFKSKSMNLLAITSASYFFTSLILLILTLKTKVSVHVAGLATIGILFSNYYGILGMIFLMLLPALAWARVHTGEHTYRQTVLGALVGLTVTALTLTLSKP